MRPSLLDPVLQATTKKESYRTFETNCCLYINEDFLVIENLSHSNNLSDTSFKF